MWYESVCEMHKNLDAYLYHYNHERTHQGRGMEGRTPYKAFLDGIPKTESRSKAAKDAA